MGVVCNTVVAYGGRVGQSGILGRKRKFNGIYNDQTPARTLGLLLLLRTVRGERTTKRSARRTVGGGPFMGLSGLDLIGVTEDFLGQC